MLEIVNKKTISFTISDNTFSQELLNIFKYSPIRINDVLSKQGDFYFGKGNWYATKICTQRHGDKITYLMGVVARAANEDNRKSLLELDKNLHPEKYK